MNDSKATITSSKSWDWISNYEATKHPCANINIEPPTITEAFTGGLSTFETETTIIIEVPEKGTLHGKVQGGSVCELYENGQYTKVNEGMTAFEIDPKKSTGKLHGVTGTGNTHSSADQTNGNFLVNEIYLSLKQPKQ